MTTDRAVAAWPRLTTTTLAAVGVLAVALAVGSLSRPMFEDQAVLTYFGWLVAHGWVPYRDFFEVNTLGAYVANAAIGWLTGYSEVGARVVDLCWLAGMLVLVAALLRGIGRTAIWAATTFAAAIYLSAGVAVTLQREVLLLPFVLAALVLESFAGAARWPALAAGLLAGIAVTIKPPAAAFVLPLAVHAWHRTRRPLAPALLLGGAAVAPMMCLVWLWQHGALEAFREMAVEYWPLHNAIGGRGGLKALSGWALMWTRIQGALDFGLHPSLPLAGAAALGTMTALRDPALTIAVRRRVWLLVGMLVAAWVGVIPASKFWVHHWWPFSVLAIVLGAMALAAGSVRVHRLAAPAALVLLASAISWGNVGPWARPPRFAFADVNRIADYLQAHRQPGDTTVPLDWVEGALHAMLRAEMTPGTTFVYDFHFRHHVSSPYIQQLRARFLREMNGNAPRFVIRIHRRSPFTGPDTAPDFPALDALLAERYRPALIEPPFEILERRDTP